MGRLFRRIAVFGLALAVPSLATQGQDDSGSPGVSPTPAHHHHRRHLHPAQSPTPDDEETPSPTPARRKHRHPVEAGDTSEPTPTATPSPDSDAGISPTPKPHPSIAPDATLDSDQLQEFSDQPEKIRTLIGSALELTRQNLTYTFSSADPANGGMDCSGFIYYVLTKAGIKDVPRDASDQYSWVRKAGKFRAVISRNLDGFELDDLKPGDLLFWSGTYQTERDPPVTHTMIYLGREKDTGNRVMAGSSDGRSYHGLQRWGVSVFDFKAVPPPGPGSSHPSTEFIGYGSIPGY